MIGLPGRTMAEAAARRYDSIRDLTVAAPLRALSWGELWKAIDAGQAKAINGVIVPHIGGGAQSRYSAIPYTSNAAVKVATTSSAKTLLQVATPSTQDITLISWFVSFDASAAATPILVEILQFDVAATVTSLTPTVYSDPNAPASLCVGGTSATGYNASVEGSPTTTLIKDFQFVAPTTGFYIQYPLGREPGIPISKFLRMRATGAASDTPNAACGFVWEE